MPPIHINSLPTEILSEIFHAYTEIFSMDPFGRIATLCLVSRQWQAVALSYTRLWTTIIAICDYEPDISPSINVLELWLKNSRDAPLEVTFVLNAALREDRIKVVDHGRRVLNLLVCHIHRWKNLHIELTWDMAALVAAIPFDEAHQLEYVYAYADFIEDGFEYDYHANDVDEQFISSLSSAPHLHSLRFGGDSPLIIEYLPEAFPLGRLTHIYLYLSCPTYLFRMLRIMQSCTSATSLAIRIRSEDDDTDGEIHEFLPAVSLVPLRFLCLEVDEVGYDMVNHFDFPNLQVLAITICHPNDLPLAGSDITPVSHFLSNMQHSLQVLAISDYALRPEQIPTFLSDPNVAKIPTVAIMTNPLPENIQTSVDAIVGTHSSDERRIVLEAGRIEPETDYYFMGWIDNKISESEAERLPGNIRDFVLSSPD